MPVGTDQDVRHPTSSDPIRGQIRGSVLLLTGRAFAGLTNFASQLVIVHYLSTSAYGAFSYGLSFATLLQPFSTLGLQRAVPRFVPMYHEKKEFTKLLGTLVLAGLTTLCTLLLLVVLVYATPQVLLNALTHDREARSLLLVLVFLVPIDGLDELLSNFFASFAEPRAIFWRRHVLGPGLKCIVVLLLVLNHSGVRFLAYGYLFASTVGVVIFGAMLVRMLHGLGTLHQLRISKLSVPVGELFRFSIPMLSSEMVTNLVLNSVAVFLLGYFRSSSEIAFYRVVVPLARMNMLVMASFSLLFTPLAARLFSRGDEDAMNKLYWRTTVWMAALTFPIFAATFAMAQPLTRMLYGERYAQSSSVLAILSLGCYFNVLLGFNDLTIRVIGKIQYILAINAVSLAVDIAACLYLIPRYGAWGAAVGTAATMIVVNLLTQVALRLASGIKIFDPEYLPFYYVIVLASPGLYLIQHYGAHSVYRSAVLTLLVSVVMVVVTKKRLRLAETFPEVMRIPIICRIV